MEKKSIETELDNKVQIADAENNRACRYDKKELTKLKKTIKPGLMAYMKKKDPGKSESTYKTYVSDSNYLLNNDLDAYFRFVRSDSDMPDIQQLIKRILIEHRGPEKVTYDGAYYYEKLLWQREYIQSSGGIDAWL